MCRSGERCTVEVHAFLRLRPPRWAFSSLGPCAHQGSFPQKSGCHDHHPPYLRTMSSSRPLRVSSVNGTARYPVPSLPKPESSHDDRRGPHRSDNGDQRPCLSCGHLMRFREWYVVTHARVTVTLPAWVCDYCGDETFVRLGPFDGRAGSEAPGPPPSRSSMDPRR